MKQKFRCIISGELFSLVLNCREKLPEDEEFAIAGDLAELEAKPIEQTNGKQEANGTIENKGIIGILFVFLRCLWIPKRSMKPKLCRHLSFLHECED